MIGSPKISVITPTKNRLLCLRETIDSVQGQSFSEWEHLVVDDGSVDGTCEELERRAATDPRIRYLRRTGDKSGANVCRNLGFQNSRADLIVFLDSDDLIRPKCLERRTQIMSRNQDLDFAVFRAGLFRKSVGDLGRLYDPQDPGDHLLRFLSLECPWQTSGPVWRRGFLEKIGCFDEALLSMQDLELHVRALSARGLYVCFPDVDHDIRCQEAGTSTSGRHYSDPVYILAAEKTPAKLIAAARAKGLLTWTRQRAVAGLAFGLAESWVYTGQLGRALEAWKRSCLQQRVPWYVRYMGILMFFAMKLSRAERGIVSRLVNKWKGWVRFRQEPALLHSPNKEASPILNDHKS